VNSDAERDSYDANISKIVGELRMRQVPAEGLATSKQLEESAALMGHSPDRAQTLAQEVLDGVPQEEALREILEVVGRLGDPAVDPAELAQMRFLSIPEVSMNAYALRQTDGATAVIFSQGLLVLMLSFVRAMAALFVPPQFWGEGAQEVEPDAIAVEVARQLSWASSRARRPDGVVLHVPSGTQNIAFHLAGFAERFVLCHELAHVVAGHLESPENAPPMASATSPRLQVVSSASWQQEFDADEVGLRALLELSSESGASRGMLYAGAELFLHVLGLLEQFAGLPVSTTHPPAAQRRARLRAQAESGLVPAAEFGFAFALDEAVERIRAPVLARSEHRLDEHGVRRGDALKARVRTLLDRYSTTKPAKHPDYVGFDREVRRLLIESPAATLDGLHDALQGAQAILDWDSNSSSPAQCRARVSGR
jgi:hypothetical protein